MGKIVDGICATRAGDMRKSFDGLHALVTQAMELDAFGGHVFVFASRRRDRIKDARPPAVASAPKPA